MRGNHFEAHHLEPDAVHQSYCRNRLYHFTQSNSDLADPSRSQSGLQPILLCFRNNLHLRFCSDPISISNDDITKFSR